MKMLRSTKYLLNVVVVWWNIMFLRVKKTERSIWRFAYDGVNDFVFTFFKDTGVCSRCFTLYILLSLVSRTEKQNSSQGNILKRTFFHLMPFHFFLLFLRVVFFFLSFFSLVFFLLFFHSYISRICFVCKVGILTPNHIIRFMSI